MEWEIRGRVGVRRIVPLRSDAAPQLGQQAALPAVGLSLAQLLGEIVFDAHLGDLILLGLDPVDMVFLVR